MLFRHAGAGQQGAWHLALAAYGAYRKAASDGMRAIIDELGDASVAPAHDRGLPHFEPRTSHFRRSQRTERLRTGMHD